MKKRPVSRPYSLTPFIIVLILLTLPMIFLSMDMWRVKLYINNLKHQIFENNENSRSTTDETPREKLIYKKEIVTSTESTEAKDYPDELLKLKDESKISMACTDVFEWTPILTDEDYQKEYPAIDFNQAGREYALNEFETKALISQAGKLAGFDSEQINGNTICYLETGEVMMMLSTSEKDEASHSTIVPKVFAGGGGGWNATVFYVDLSGGMNLVASVPAKSVAYWGCSAIYSVTKEGTYYIGCGGGDGGGSPGNPRRTIYRGDLFSKEIVPIFDCTNVLANDETLKWECK